MLHAAYVFVVLQSVFYLYFFAKTFFETLDVFSEYFLKVLEHYIEKENIEMSLSKYKCICLGKTRKCKLRPDSR